MAVLLLSDADLACVIKMSRSWVRKQRMLRRAGLPHELALEPIMIDRAPGGGVGAVILSSVGRSIRLPQSAA